MKKWLVILGLVVGLKGFSYADELRPQFRVWKSSYLGTKEIFNTLIASSTIIFHTVLGSPTINNSGSSYLAILRVLDSDFVSVTATTRAYIPLNVSVSSNSNNIATHRPGIGDIYDVKVTSKSFITKQGGADIQYLWDWLNAPDGNIIHEQDAN